MDDVAVPFVVGLAGHEGDDFAAGRRRVLDHGQRIDPDQFTGDIGVTVAGARAPVGDVTHHRTGVATDLAVDSTFDWLLDHGDIPLRLRQSPFLFICIQTIIGALGRAVKRAAPFMAPLTNDARELNRRARAG